MKKNKYQKWIHESWFPGIEPALSIFENHIALILGQIKTKVQIFPEQNNTFRAFSCPLDELKVVILGQDPYHNPGSATGRAFENLNTKNRSPSLHNIMTEMINDNIENVDGYDVDKQKPFGEFHAKQGVLLLNTALTVEQGNPGSHLDLWKPFTEEIMKLLSQKDELIWVLWGKKAQAYKRLITNDTHYFIESPHPSPFSAWKGFFDSRPFSRINSILSKLNKGTITW